MKEPKELPEPLIKWIIGNINTDQESAFQTPNGVMIHITEVIRLIKLRDRSK